MKVEREQALRKVHAYYGSLEAYQAIPDWEHFDVSHNSETPILLDHGYDESKAVDSLTDAELDKAAAFRGGKYLGDNNWQCAQGHLFKASRRLILLGGHWCPDCFPYPYPFEPEEKQRPWAWDQEARRNPFFAQLWSPLHEPDTDYTYMVEDL